MVRCQGHRAAITPDRVIETAQRQVDLTGLLQADKVVLKAGLKLDQGLLGLLAPSGIDHGPDSRQPRLAARGETVASSQKRTRSG